MQEDPGRDHVCTRADEESGKALGIDRNAKGDRYSDIPDLRVVPDALSYRHVPV